MVNFFSGIDRFFLSVFKVTVPFAINRLDEVYMLLFNIVVQMEE